MDVQRSLLLICHSKTFSGQCAKTQLLSAVKCISWPERVRWGESKKVSILIFVDFLLVDFTSSLMLLYTEDLCVGQWQWISYFILGTCCFIYIQINKDKHSRNIKIITLDKFTQKHTHTHRKVTAHVQPACDVVRSVNVARTALPDSYRATSSSVPQVQQDPPQLWWASAPQPDPLQRKTFSLLLLRQEVLVLLWPCHAHLNTHWNTV